MRRWLEVLRVGGALFLAGVSVTHLDEDDLLTRAIYVAALALCCLTIADALLDDGERR